MNKTKTVLIADNDINVLQFLKIRLSYLGYIVIVASNGQEVLSLFKKETPNILILDIMLSKVDGYKICKILRKNYQIPIILLTALAKKKDVIRGLNVGANQYLIKPFSPEELESCINSSLTRFYSTNHLNSFILQVGNLKLNTFERLVTKNNKLFKLTSVESNLLKLLMIRAGEALTRITIFNCIWGYTSYRYVDTRVIDVYIFRLRAKLEQEPSKPTLILTIRGKGYMLNILEN